MKNRVYLDYAAATPTDPNVAQAMQEVQGVFANPSAQYGSARESREVLDQARKDTAMFLGANSDEVIFSSGATESNNLAILGTAMAQPKGRIISVATEHASVREPLNLLKKAGYDVVFCGVKPNGEIHLDELKQTLTKDTILVSLAYANGEIGTTQPITKVSKLIREFENESGATIVFHTDASAAAPLLNCEVSRLGVDLMTLSGNKVYGPAGVGVLYVRRGTKLQPSQYGGGQELGLRPGTQPVELTVGMAEALKLVQDRRKKDEKHFIELSNEFKKTLGKRVEIISKNKLPNIVSISFDGVNGEDIVAYMDAAGFEMATGAACEAAHKDPSQTLLAIGLTKAQAQGTIRISFGRQTTNSEVKATAKSLIKTLDTLGYKWDNKTQ